jgi:hypothetical protein
MKRIAITTFLTLTAALGVFAISQAASPPHHSITVRSSTSSSDVPLPASTVKQLTTPGTLTSEYELEPEQATYDAAAHTWVIPGRGGMCLAVSTPDGNYVDTGCGLIANANAGGLVMVRRSASGPVIYGFVPPGASVTVTDADGSNASPSVTDSVFMYADPTARSVTVHVGSGGTTTPIYQASQG